MVIGPADLPVTEGSTLIVYAVGSLDAGTVTTVTETIGGSGSAPGRVDTGNSPVSDGERRRVAAWVLAGLGGGRCRDRRRSPGPCGPPLRRRPCAAGRPRGRRGPPCRRRPGAGGGAARRVRVGRRRPDEDAPSAPAAGARHDDRGTVAAGRGGAPAPPAPVIPVVPVGGPEPTALTIEALGVSGAPVRPVGVEPDGGAMEIPPVDEVGWYQFGARPGDPGSTVLAAHVAYDGVDGVFRHLDDLGAGDGVTVALSDGSRQTFVVTEVARHPKSELPAAVWAPRATRSSSSSPAAANSTQRAVRTRTMSSCSPGPHEEPNGA